MRKVNLTIKLILLLICLYQLGCGVIVGTAVDATISVATYPFKEYVFNEAYKYDNTWETNYKPVQIKKNPGKVLLGIAVSGGGSRSAYFTACILEELSKIPIAPESKVSYVDEIDYISSVSGGSLASAYFCLKKYQNKKSKKNFYTQFKKDMKQNFQIKALGHYTIGGDWFLDFFTYYDRGDLMANVWDTTFFNKATFADLAKAEQNGAPQLIINGTSLNDGLKFVFSNLPDEKFNNSQYFVNMRNSGFIKHAITKEHKAFKVIGFQGINSDIQPYRISKAVAASASVPNLLGPVTLKDYSKKDRERLIHIVDGGVYDNYGIESLMQVFTKYLDKHPGTPAKIIVIDGSGYFKELDEHTDTFTVAEYSERPLSIAWLRTKAYMEFIFKKANKFRDKDGKYPYKNLDFELLSLYGILPSQEKQKAIVEEKALQKILRPDITASDFLEKIITIKTMFKLPSVDAKTIEDVAKKVVKRLK